MFMFPLQTQNITDSFTRGVNTCEITPKWLHRATFNCVSKPNNYQCFARKQNEISTLTVDHNNDEFLLNAATMNFIERLSLAWRILFPTTAERKHSNAKIAKQRLKMILFSDR
uniref:Uncharacterized protein n=1 Tax=Ananas comosus var. bracteatus TaxID=296719 RepID=A0A6V7QE53_ANACO|nr:unnamed protein product [Ananas comosus var. bracteatus]